MDYEALKAESLRRNYFVKLTPLTEKILAEYPLPGQKSNANDDESEDWRPVKGGKKSRRRPRKEPSLTTTKTRKPRVLGQTKSLEDEFFNEDEEEKEEEMEEEAMDSRGSEEEVPMGGSVLQERSVRRKRDRDWSPFYQSTTLKGEGGGEGGRERGKQKDTGGGGFRNKVRLELPHLQHSHSSSSFSSADALDLPSR